MQRDRNEFQQTRKEIPDVSMLCIYYIFMRMDNYVYMHIHLYNRQRENKCKNKLGILELRTADLVDATLASKLMAFDLGSLVKF